MASYKNIPGITVITHLAAFNRIAGGFEPENYDDPELINTCQIVNCNEGATHTGDSKCTGIPKQFNERIFLMSDKISEDKINILTAYGAEIIILPASALPDSYTDEADRFGMDITDTDSGILIC